MRLDWREKSVKLESESGFREEPTKVSVVEVAEIRPLFVVVPLRDDTSSDREDAFVDAVEVLFVGTLCTWTCWQIHCCIFPPFNKALRSAT